MRLKVMAAILTVVVLSVCIALSVKAIRFQNNVEEFTENQSTPHYLQKGESPGLWPGGRKVAIDPAGPVWARKVVGDFLMGAWDRVVSVSCENAPAPLASLATFRSLQFLTLRKTDIDIPLVNTISLLSGLRHLEIRETAMSDTVGCALVGATTLDVVVIMNEERITGQFFCCLSRNSHLKDLIIIDAPSAIISDKTCCVGFSGLTTLVLGGANFGDESVACFCKHRNVTSVSLLGCDISSASIRFLASCGHLEKLMVLDGWLDVEDFRVFTQSSVLKELWLRNVFVLEEDYKKLRRILPHVNVQGGNISTVVPGALIE